MNPQLMRLMKLHRLYREPAGEGGSNDGGTGSGQGGAGGGQGAGSGGEGGTGDGSGAGGGQGGQSGGTGDGGKPSEEVAKLVKDVMKHKERAQNAETKLNEIQAQLKQFEGIDPAKVRELLQTQADEERKKAEARGEYDRLIAQMGERHKEETAALRKQIEDAQAGTAGLQRQIAEITVGASFTGSKFVAEDLTLTPAKARVIYGQHFEFKDGQVVGYDKPQGASDRTMLVDSTGNALPFDEALRKIVEADPDKDHLVRSKVKPGAGSSSNRSAARAAGDPGQDSKPRSSIDKIAAGLANLAKK